MTVPAFTKTLGGDTGGIVKRARQAHAYTQKSHAKRGKTGIPLRHLLGSLRTDIARQIAGQRHLRRPQHLTQQRDGNHPQAVHSNLDADQAARRHVDL